MNYSRKQLYALGEPFGDSATRLKPGGRVYGGGGSSTPADTTNTTTVELPEWARGYAKDTLAKASALTDINKNPYQQYGANRIAGFNPMQQQAFAGAAGMQPSQQVGMGSDIAGAAGLGALGANYQGGNFQGGLFDNQAAGQYMNPYTQNVVDYQKSQALRDFQIAQPMRQAQAVQQGAFGGSRSAIMDAEAQRSLNSQLQGIEATGQQNAYANAQQQFNTDQSRRLQAQQLGEQSRQYGAGLGMQGLQTGLQAASTLGQLGQTQYGQQMGINQLQSQYGQQQQQQAQRPLDMAYQDFMNQQNYPYKQLGFMSDMVRGLPLGQQSTAQVYQAPPSTMQTVGALGLGAYGINQMMKAKGGLAESYAGGGMVAFGDGGDTDVTDSPMDDPSVMAKEVSKLSDQQLQEIIQHPSSAAELQAAKMELATRASEKNGLASAYNMMPQQAPTTQATPQAPQMAQQAPQQPMMQAARGGIMGFADEGAVESDDDDEETARIAGLLENQVSNVQPTGNEVARQKWEDRLGKSYENLETTTSRPMTDAERRTNTLANYKEVQDMAGPSPYAAQNDRIAGLEASQVSNLEQQKGLAAFAAIPEILKGGNAARGLGGAAGAFGGMYGKAIQAGREEKRSLMSMKNNLEDAQYKMRVGLVGDARQLTAEARRDQQAAAAANIAKQKAMGILAKEGVKLNAPIKPAAVKFEPADSKALTNLENSYIQKTPLLKGETEEQRVVRAKADATNDYLTQKAQREIQSNANIRSTQMQDTGPVKATTGAETTESTEISKGASAFEAMAGKLVKTKEEKATVAKYMEANGNDLAKAANAYGRDTRVTPKAATGNNPAPAPAPVPAPKPNAAPAKSVLPPGTTTGKFIQGKGTEVLKDGKVIGYAN
jgi:hypothetical protein